MIIAGQWEVIEPLGEGGMGMVYKVRHYQMQEIILAVKMLSPELMENQALVARFYREGSVMSRFRHKHVVRVFSAGAVYDENLRRHYILMEYIHGKTLRDHLRDLKKGDRKPFSLVEVLEISRQMAEALAHAHNQTPSIIHRDLKPGNIMIEDPTKDYPLGRAVLMDWGIAKELKDTDDTQLTGIWTMVGTPKYCSPEQLRPLETLTGSADIYSLGMVMYEMQAGKQFFADLDTESVVRRVRDDPEENEPYFPQPTPPEFVALVRKAIAKARSRRYTRMEELLRDIEECRAVIEEKTAATIIRPAPEDLTGATVVRPAPEVEDREGLRRRREEEQRNLTLELQQEAKRDRERAVSEGAEEWAANLFQQASLQEAEGAKRLGERNYFLAQDAYNEAIRLFGNAREEAIAVALRRAEQARNEMMTAKRGAERYRARERARRFYTSGLAFENEAGEVWEQKRYQQAWEIFARAKSAFEDARELAAETIRNEIESVRERAETQRNSAAADEAAELAGDTFEEAQRQTQEAAAAFEREDFTLAQQLYETAARRYEQAQQQAQEERKRRETVAAQRRAADDARRKLEDAKAAGDPLRAAVEEQWATAQQVEAQGEDAYRSERYEDAQRAYEQAERRYTLARAEGEKLQRAAAKVQAQVEKVRAAAQRAQAREYASDYLQQAEETYHAAVQFFQERRYRQAAAQYDAATQQYEAATEAAEAAQRQQASAVDEKRQAEQAQRGATAARAEHYAAALFSQAQADYTQGETHLSAKEWGAAGEAFAQAQTCFVQAQQEAQRAKKQAKEDTETVRKQALAAQRDAAAGEHFFPERWAQAAETIAQAAQALHAEDYGTAQAGFVQATSEFRQLFEAVREVAEREALKGAAEAAQKRGEEQRTEAITVEAQELARPIFEEAEKRAGEAAAAFAQEQFSQARRAYDEAAHLYEQAQQHARTERERRELLAVQRRAAEETRRQLEAAKIAAEAFRSTVEEQWAAARQWEQQGEESYRGELYEDAQQAYETATQLYAQLRVEGEKHKHAADVAQVQATQSRETAQQALAQGYAAGLFQQAEIAWQTASQEYTAGRYGQATDQYETARRVYEEARTESLAARQRHEQAVTAKGQAEHAQQKTAAVQAELYAPALLAQARTAQAQGESYFQDKRWGEAAEAFAHAHTLFAHAQQEAQNAKAQARQAAEAARDQALAAQQAAADGEQLFAEQWTQAVTLVEQAFRAFAAEDYKAAQAGFIQTTTQFQQISEAVRENAEREARKSAAETARAQAEKCRTEAVATASEEFAHPVFDTAEQQAKAALAAFAQENFTQAKQLFEATAQLYEQARQQARAERQRRELLATLRRAADEARQRLMATKSAGEFFQLAVEEQWTEAQRWEQQGEEAYRREQYEEAQQAYQAGTQLYAQVEREGAQRKQKAEGTRAHAEQSREAAVQTQAQEYAGDFFRQGESAEQTGGQAYMERRYAQAAQQYAQAVLQFEKARAAAQEGRQLHAQAIERKKQAENAQQGAVKAEAQRYVPELFAQAQTVHTQGAQHLQAKRWDEAVEAFTRAHTLFAQAQQDAQKVKTQARQATVAARGEAIIAQREAAEGEQIFPDQWSAGRVAFAQADQASEREDYSTAQKGFAQALAIFRKLHQETIIYIQKGKAEQAKAHVLDLQSKTAGAKGRQKKRAEKVLANAELLFQQGKYNEAQANYEEVASLLAVLQHTAVEPGGPAAIRRPAVLFGASGGLFAAGLALYWALTAQEPVISQRTSLSETPAETEPQPEVQPPAPPKPDPESRPPVSTTPENPQQGPTEDGQPKKPDETTGPEQPEKPDETTDPRIAGIKPIVPLEPSPPSPLEEPVLEPPQITAAEPRTKDVTVAEGQKLTFAVEAESEGKLQYTWFLDRKKQVEGKKWTYQPGFDDATDKPKEIKVVVSGGNIPPVEQIWQVRVQDVNRPPLIAKTVPKAGSVEMSVGETQKLSVQASDPDKDDRLTYTWWIGEAKVAEGTNPDWQIPSSTPAGSHRVTVEVGDKAGMKDQIAWNVTVKAPAQPPLITGIEPKDSTLTTQTGEPLDFSITASVADESPGAGRRLRYQWEVKDAPPKQTDIGQFRFLEKKPGTYQLQVVAISPEGLQSAPRKWTIEVKAPDIAALPREPVRPRPSSTELSETEARNWLETTYRQAWEGKKVDTLVRLGEVPSDQAAKLQSILNDYKSFRVDLRDISVRKDGRNRVTIRFTRVDTVNGRVLPHPPKELVIEKLSDGRIAKR